MKKMIALLLVFILALGFAGCGSTEKDSESQGSSQAQSENGTAKKVASEGAKMQTENPNRPTRVIENGTRINMHFGDTIIPGILNDSETAQALIDRLPYTVHVSRYSHDFAA